MSVEETFALIAGGGPVGLTLAMELGLRNVPCIVVNDQLEPTRHPKCNHVSVRSMELLRRHGLSSRIRAAGKPADYSNDTVYLTRLFGRELSRLRQPLTRDVVATFRADPGYWPTPEPKHLVSQLYLEPILRDGAAGYASVDVRYGWRLISFENRDDRVEATVERIADGAIRKLQAAYLVGCDGAGSMVRRTLEIDLLGEDGTAQSPFLGGTMLSIYFRSAELLSRMCCSPAFLHWIVNPEQRGMLFAQDGKELWLSHVSIPAGRDWRSIDQRQLLEKLAGGPFEFEILSVGPWTAGYALVARDYRQGRTFLCGDAAHLFTPTAGFGMNTGLGDAVDLGWKLAAAYRGWAGPNLLDSYHAERRPIGERNTLAGLSHARRIGAWKLPPDLESEGDSGAAAREQFGAFLAGNDARQYDTAGILLGYRYSGSPIVIPDGTPEPADDPERYVPSAWPGMRAPHFWRADESSIYDHLGAEFTLMRIGDGAPDAAIVVNTFSARGVPLKVLDVAEEAALALYGASLALIRPDQHVAWRGNETPADPAALVERVRGGLVQP